MNDEENRSHSEESPIEKSAAQKALHRLSAAAVLIAATVLGAILFLIAAAISLSGERSACRVMCSAAFALLGLSSVSFGFLYPVAMRGERKGGKPAGDEVSTSIKVASALVTVIGVSANLFLGIAE